LFTEERQQIQKVQLLSVKSQTHINKEGEKK